MIQATPLPPFETPYTALLHRQACLQLKKWGVKDEDLLNPRFWVRELVEAMVNGLAENNPFTQEEFLSYRSNWDEEWTGVPISTKATELNSFKINEPKRREQCE